MGGFGSGRRGGKPCTEDRWALDVNSLQRLGLLTVGQSFRCNWKRNDEIVSFINLRVDAGCVFLAYQQRLHGGDWQAMNYPVALAWTPCLYGGARMWWLCPVAGCGLRVGVLFAGALFACRHCHGLAYRCQRETITDRAIGQGDKLRDRLGWGGGILNSNGCKPKGMHWRTFNRLNARHDTYANQVLASMPKKLASQSS